MLAIVSINSHPPNKHQFNVKRLHDDGTVRQYFVVRQTENVYIMPDAQVYELLTTDKEAIDSRIEMLINRIQECSYDYE